MSQRLNRPPATCGQPAGIIFDVKRFAIHDGPGIRTTVFFKGCPLRCRWCHNPESWQQRPEHSFRAGRCVGCGRCVEACPTGARTGLGKSSSIDPSRCRFCGACAEACPTGAREILGREVSVGEVMAEIRRDVVFYDQSGGGVTFSGGEALMQAAFLRALLVRCRAEGIHTALDTTCYAPWEELERTSEHVDLFLVDLKHMDRAAHERFTGVPNELILENARRLARLGREIIIRVPVIPGVNDDGENVAATAAFVSSLGGVHRIDLLPQNGTARAKSARLTTEHNLLHQEPPSAEEMEAIAARLEDSGFSVKIGG